MFRLLHRSCRNLQVLRPNQLKLWVLLWSLHSHSPLLSVILHMHRVHQTAVEISQQAQSDIILPWSHEAFRLWDLIFEDIELYSTHCTYVKFIYLSWLICIIHCVTTVGSLPKMQQDLLDGQLVLIVFYYNDVCVMYCWITKRSHVS